MAKLSPDQITEKLNALPGWERKGEAIAKQYTFKAFMDGIRFLNRIAEIAEQMDHHPDVTINYRRITFTLSTHDQGGITEKDFKLAEAIEREFPSKREFTRLRNRDRIRRVLRYDGIRAGGCMIPRRNVFFDIRDAGFRRRSQPTRGRARGGWRGAGLETATFAGGCFWCMQPAFDHIPGVVSTTVGYTGGDKDHPTYEEVSDGGTGHAESIEITFDPKKVSYQKLLDVFWHNVDPTSRIASSATLGISIAPRFSSMDLNRKQRRKRRRNKSRRPSRSRKRS